jgi:hypothetical protein
LYRILCTLDPPRIPCYEQGLRASRHCHYPCFN